jgi:hypothetical protein
MLCIYLRKENTKQTCEKQAKHVTCHFWESSVAHPARHVSFMEEYESDTNDGLEISNITEHTSLLNLR